MLGPKLPSRAGLKQLSGINVSSLFIYRNITGLYLSKGLDGTQFTIAGATLAAVDEASLPELPSLPEPMPQDSTEIVDVVTFIRRFPKSKMVVSSKTKLLDKQKVVLLVIGPPLHFEDPSRKRGKRRCYGNCCCHGDGVGSG
ncbi:hypothetical protein JTE90_001739 [Oedothorax gibbosus]|uniref:Uncharacterized protein n=1 Tax=Oedothorax gibbosus TaxID=931172 RepID=A0AAV6V7W9_9ARAC|nr:hypothetical protein JTE90_001739 [Oedothorax gibbosus]